MARSIWKGSITFGLVNIPVGLYSAEKREETVSFHSPLFFDKPYYLAPEKRGAKSYALLRETLRRTKKVGISKVVIRTKQYLAAVLVEQDAIVLNVLRFAHELRDPKELELPSGKEGVSERELDMAERLVEGMVSGWKPEKYRDDYYKDLKKLIKERVEAGQLEESPEAPPKPKPERGGQVVDLMALLKQSVEGKPGRKPAKAAKKPAAKKAARKPARKTVPKRKTA